MCFPQPIGELKTTIPVERIWDTSSQEPISELETRILVKRVGIRDFSIQFQPIKFVY